MSLREEKIMFTGIDKKTGLITECKAKDKDTCPYHKPGTHNDERSKNDIMNYNENILNNHNEHIPSLSKKADIGSDDIPTIINGTYTIGDPNVNAEYITTLPTGESMGTFVVNGHPLVQLENMYTDYESVTLMNNWDSSPETIAQVITFLNKDLGYKRYSDISDINEEIELEEIIVEPS
jgi:hypothetical protein